jgi:hypothetical protein
MKLDPLTTGAGGASLSVHLRTESDTVPEMCSVWNPHGTVIILI